MGVVSARKKTDGGGTGSRTVRTSSRPTANASPPTYTNSSHDKTSPSVNAATSSRPSTYGTYGASGSSASTNVSTGASNGASSAPVGSKQSSASTNADRGSIDHTGESGEQGLARGGPTNWSPAYRQQMKTIVGGFGSKGGEEQEK